MFLVCIIDDVVPDGCSGNGTSHRDRIRRQADGPSFRRGWYRPAADRHGDGENPRTIARE
jgi:hypothetical protein